MKDVLPPEHEKIKYGLYLGVVDGIMVNNWCLTIGGIYQPLEDQKLGW